MHQSFRKSRHAFLKTGSLAGEVIPEARGFVLERAKADAERAIRSQ
jgi:hypothetical protein